MTAHFLYNKIRISTWIFWNFFHKPPFKFLQQLYDYSENDLVLKFIDDFPVSYASLTTKVVILYSP